MALTFVPYEDSHYSICMDIIQSNTPKFIDHTEHEDFKKYLSRKDKNYFVIYKNDELIACGGYELNPSKTKAGLSWGLVHRNFHKQGIGRELIQFRINHIQSHFPKVEIQLDTSQHTYQFFEKFGFKLINIAKNGWAEGLHKYHMVLT